MMHSFYSVAEMDRYWQSVSTLVHYTAILGELYISRLVWVKVWYGICAVRRSYNKDVIHYTAIY